MVSNAMVKENYVSEIFPTGGQYSKKRAFAKHTLAYPCQLTSRKSPN